MGNIIETESDVSDHDSPSNLTKPFPTEPRTEGDGMENTEKNNNCPGGGDIFESQVDPDQLFIAPDSTNAVTLNIQKAESKSGISSPMYLPPRHLLIAVRAKRNSGEKMFTEKASVNQKQRAPRFVPYEPYSCAVRPMVKVSSKSSETKSLEDDFSSVEINEPEESITDVKRAGLQAPQAPIERNLKSVITDVERSTNKCSSPNRNCRSNCNNDNLNHTGVSALKERLRVALSDVEHLKDENSKLKKMLVDSLAGGPPSNEPQNESLDNSNRAHEDSISNLNDQMEVIRSKFLSSCILIEQLAKKNNDLMGHMLFASDLLREFKLTGSLSPVLFSSVNDWLRQFESLKESCNTGAPSFSDNAHPTD